MEISGLLQPFIIIYKEFKFFCHRRVYKSLIWASKLSGPKSIKQCPNSSRIVPGY